MLLLAAVSLLASVLIVPPRDARAETVTVALNSAPSFTEGAFATRTIDEDTGGAAGAVRNVGAAVAATDADTADTLAYSVISTGAELAAFNASFTLEAATGQIKTKADVLLDYEATNSWTVSLRVADGQGGTGAVRVTIELTDVAEPPPTPGAPNAAATSHADDSIAVWWDPPDMAGRPPITGYMIQYKLTSAPASSYTSHAHTGTNSFSTIGSLTAGASYDVQVRAVNAEGHSDWSEAGTNRLGVLAAGQPSISGTARVGQTLMASIAGIADGVAGVTHRFQWMRGSTDVGTNSSSYTVVAADIGHKLRVRVTFFDQLNNFEQRFSADTATVVADNVPPQFSAPADTAVSVEENRKIAFTVRASDDDDADSVYRFSLSGADASKFELWTPAPQETPPEAELNFRTAPDYERPTDAASTTPANGAGNNEYVVTVTAHSGSGSRARSVSRTFTVTVTDVAEPPGVPAPRVSAASAASLTVTWPEPANTGPAITGYGVQYREGASGSFTPWAHTGTGRTATIGGLTAGTSYQVQVQARSDEGASRWSLPITGVAGEDPPPIITDPGGPQGNGGSPGGGGSGGSGGGGGVRPVRLSGADRYATAAAVAGRLVGLLEAPDASGGHEEVDTVIVASGQSFPDALAASALSRARRAPVLLTSQGRLEPAVRSFITRHRIANVVIVGGPAAVSEAVAQALEAMDEVAGVVRHAGADRYATAARIAAVVGEPAVHCGTFDRAVIVTTGRSFPDALVAGPLAYRGPHPILLTDPQRLPEPTRAYLDDTTATLAIVIGGEGAVSAEVASQIERLGLSVRRISGADRADTSVQVARYLTDTTSCFRNDSVGLATGWSFPDALAAAPLLGHYGAPLLLTSPDGVPQPLLDYAAEGLLERGDDLPPVITIGGTAAVPSRHPNQILANTPR